MKKEHFGIMAFFGFVLFSIPPIFNLTQKGIMFTGLFFGASLLIIGVVGFITKDSQKELKKENEK